MNYKLKELCEITSSNRIFAKEYRTFGIPFYRSKEVIQLSLKRKVVPSIFISENRYNKIVESGQDVPKVGDILITAIGGANRGYPWYVDHFPIYFKDGNLIWLRNFKQFCNSKFLSYYLSTIKSIKNIQNASFGTVQSAITIDLIRNINIYLPPLNTQQHIINTIGSVDDLIDNLTKQNEILLNLEKNKIDNLNESEKLYPLTNIVQFKKGFEVGSSKYSETKNPGQINYIRVGDLKSLGNTFVDTLDNYTYADFEDILVAFDGAPGRNNIGLVGAYSSGIYKLICLNEDKGLVFFEINSKINKQIIDIHTYGTTIKHASKSINFLVYANVDHKEKQILNWYFKQIIQNKKKINILKQIKANLLNKYF